MDHIAFGNTQHGKKPYRCLRKKSLGDIFGCTHSSPSGSPSVQCCHAEGSVWRRTRLFFRRPAHWRRPLGSTLNLGVRGNAGCPGICPEAFFSQTPDSRWFFTCRFIVVCFVSWRTQDGIDATPVMSMVHSPRCEVWAEAMLPLPRAPCRSS